MVPANERQQFSRTPSSPSASIVVLTPRRFRFCLRALFSGLFSRILWVTLLGESGALCRLVEFFCLALACRWAPNGRRSLLGEVSYLSTTAFISDFPCFYSHCRSRCGMLTPSQKLVHGVISRFRGLYPVSCLCINQRHVELRSSQLVTYVLS